jgi:hypothetical protein
MGSDLGQEALADDFRGFSQSFQTNSGIVTEIRPLPLIHHSVVIFLFDPHQSELPTTPLNKP